MISADDTTKIRAAWLQRRDNPAVNQKTVTDVPRDLANSIDENGSLVTVPPEDWIICFVPGLQAVSYTTSPSPRDS